jgi:hypothetical protein
LLNVIVKTKQKMSSFDSTKDQTWQILNKLGSLPFNECQELSRGNGTWVTDRDGHTDFVGRPADPWARIVTEVRSPDGYVMTVGDIVSLLWYNHPPGARVNLEQPKDQIFGWADGIKHHLTQAPAGDKHPRRDKLNIGAQRYNDFNHV